MVSAKWWRKWTDYVNYEAVQQTFRVLTSEGQLNESDIDEICGDKRYNESPGPIMTL